MSDETPNLTDDEKKLLTLLGKLHISESKNCSEATIRKKLPSKYHSGLSKTIKSLHSKGLLRYYRNKNYALTRQGMRIANELASELQRELYFDLRFLLIL